jgi:hypothetical protein
VKATEIRYIIDAGPIIGALSAADQWHDWSRRILALIDEPVATTEIVFGEACHRLKTYRLGLYAAVDGARAGRFLLLPQWVEHGGRALELLQKYPQMDAGDCSLVILSELLPRATIITTDAGHFRVYRRFRSQSLPLLTPG